MTQHLHMVVWVFVLSKRNCGGHRLPTQCLAWLIKQIRCTGVLLILHLQFLNFLLYGGSFSINNLEIKIIIKLADWMTQHNLNHHILLSDCQIKLKVRYYTELTGICKVKSRSILSTIPINNSQPLVYWAFVTKIQNIIKFDDGSQYIPTLLKRT